LALDENPNADQGNPPELELGPSLGVSSASESHAVEEEEAPEPKPW